MFSTDLAAPRCFAPDCACLPLVVLACAWLRLAGCCWLFRAAPGPTGFLVWPLPYLETTVPRLISLGIISLNAARVVFSASASSLSYHHHHHHHHHHGHQHHHHRHHLLGPPRHCFGQTPLRPCCTVLSAKRADNSTGACGENMCLTAPNTASPRRYLDQTTLRSDPPPTPAVSSCPPSACHQKR